MSNELKVDVSYVIFVPNGAYLYWNNILKSKWTKPIARARSEERKSASSNDQIAIHFVSFCFVSVWVCVCVCFPILFEDSPTKATESNINNNKKLRVRGERRCGVIDGYFVVDSHSWPF